MIARDGRYAGTGLPTQGISLGQPESHGRSSNMVEFVMPTCEELVEQLYALRRDMLAILGDENCTDRAGAVIDRFDRIIGRYED